MLSSFLTLIETGIDKVRQQVQSLSLEQLEALSEALLDFSAIADLLNWLQANQTA